MKDDGLHDDGLVMIRLLGPAQVCGPAATVPASGKDALFLAELLLHQGTAVSRQHLVEALWGDALPRDPSNAVQVRASRLRGLLRAAAGSSGADMLSARAGSYALTGHGLRSDVAAAEQDALTASRAEAASEWARALELAERAEHGWRGELLGGAVLGPCLAALSDRLTETRLSAVETALAAELALGRPDAAVRTAVPLLSRHPYRERLHALVIRALAQADRSGEALEHYAKLRDSLVRELGTEPGAELRALHARILRGELHGELRAEPCGEPHGEARNLKPDRCSDPAGGPAQPGPPVLPASSTLPAQLGSPVPPASPALPASPTALRPGPPPASLPPGPLCFVGRQAALADIRRALTDPRTADRPAVLSGMPGIGKTALALAAAHTLREEFPDGQVFHRAGHDADAGVRDLLARTRTLVILDDVRSAAQLRHLLPAEPRGAALVTSQSQLSAFDVSARIRLGPLVPSDSAALLQHASGPGGLTPALAERLADLCGHLPLALRVVAARLASAGAQAPEAAARRLTGDMADRQARSALLEFDDLSVRRALLRPLRQVDRAAAAALRHLAEDEADSWETPSAARVLGIRGWKATGVLDRLVEMSLLDVVGGRLRLHPLLRDVLCASGVRPMIPGASASSARRYAGFLQGCRARSDPAGVSRPRRVPREGGTMQLETCVELAETEELELTADAAESTDGPDWILFSW